MSLHSWQSILQNCAVENVKSYGNKNHSDDKRNDTDWMKSFSTKANIFYGATPYMPILLENIPNYIQLDDFEFDRIKEIQTLGIVYGETWQAATLHNFNPDYKIYIQLTFACCKYESLFEKGYRMGMELPCKIFGRLVRSEGKPLLEVHHLIKTDDLEGSLKTAKMISQMVRQKYHYYSCSSNP